LLAGLTTIPHELAEAAAVDGAGRGAVRHLVTLPLLTPTIYFVLVVSTVESLKVFSQIYARQVGDRAPA
jgi:ABC-type sugar transport system permease subunit